MTGRDATIDRRMPLGGIALALLGLLLALATSWPLVLVFVGTAIALRALLQGWSTAAARRRTS